MSQSVLAGAGASAAKIGAGAAQTRSFEHVPMAGLGNNLVLSAGILGVLDFDWNDVECLQFENGRHYETLSKESVLLDMEGFPIECDPSAGIVTPSTAAVATTGLSNGLLIGLLAGLGGIIMGVSGGSSSTTGGGGAPDSPG